MTRTKYYACVVACWALLAVVGRATPAKIEGLEQTQEIDDVNDRDPRLPRTCELSTDINETSFQNPGYPSATSIPTDACRHKVYPVNDYICQIRLDLKDFILAQPDWDGVCATDFMQVSGAMTKIPQICGINSGQHLYLEVTPDFGSVTINVDTSAQGAKWSISVAQIECNSPYRAPAGCLQYFTNTYGTIKSFNYDATTFNSPNTPPTATTQLASQAYGVCIKPQSGFCSVAYTKTSVVANDYTFSLTGDASIFPPGGPLPGYAGSADCTTDYVMIPGGTLMDTNYAVISADRYCGTNFPSKVESSIQPFALYVVTDDTETNYADTALLDGPNVGFSIDYRMQSC